jgi:hypothetical protein
VVCVLNDEERARLPALSIAARDSLSMVISVRRVPPERLVERTLRRVQRVQLIRSPLREPVHVPPVSQERPPLP